MLSIWSNYDKSCKCKIGINFNTTVRHANISFFTPCTKWCKKHPFHSPPKTENIYMYLVNKPRLKDCPKNEQLAEL